MYRIQDDPINLYRSPSQVLRYFELLKQEVGNVVLNDNEFQKDREAWIAAVFLLGYRLIQKSSYWIKTIKDSDSPDILAVAIKKMVRAKKIGRVKLEMRLEIAEFEQNNKEDLGALIKKKLKFYSPDTRLVVYVHGRAGESVDLDELFKDVKQMNPRIAEIWLLGSVQSSNTNLYALTQLYPLKNQRFYDYLQEANKTKQRRIILDLGRGFQNKFDKNIGKAVIFKGPLADK